MNHRRAITPRITGRRPGAARAIPAPRVLRVPHYNTAAEVPPDLPVGSHITLPAGEPPPPGWTPVGSGDDES